MIKFDPAGCRISIKEKAFKVFTHDPPVDGWRKFSLEAVSVARYDFEQELHPRTLSGITPAMLPEGLSITISRPTSKFRGAFFLQFHMRASTAELEYCLELSFHTWEHEINLSTFADRFISALQAIYPKIRKASRAHENGCIIFTITVAIQNNEDLFAAFDDFDETVDKLYRQLLRTAELPLKAPLEKSTPDEGIKWWIRYVFVPLAGSGAVAAFLIWALG